MQDDAEESICETFEDGPWLAIVRTRRGITFYPRNRSKQPRFERFLPSGERLVDDIHDGLVLRSEFYADFDVARSRPKGRKLGNRKVMALQQSGREWFIFTYQDRYGSEDELVASDLRLIERHMGVVCVEVIEVCS